MVQILDTAGYRMAICTPETAAIMVAKGHAMPTDHPAAIVAITTGPARRR